MITTNFFLKKHHLSERTQQLLQDLYPTVNWSRVDFYEGLPWFTPILAPYVTAQALPQFYSFSHYRIYILKFEESRPKCIADIVHEGMHIVQSMKYLNGYGLGFLRGFSVYYGALFSKHGYRENPFEIPAYEQEYRFLAFCEKYTNNNLRMNTAIYTAAKKESSLIFTECKITYEEKAYRLFISFLACLLISVLKPAADCVVFVIWIFTKRKNTN